MSGEADETILNVLNKLSIMNELEHKGKIISNIMDYHGQWTSGDYKINDIIIYNNATYICKQNTLSQENPTHTDYWGCLAINDPSLLNNNNTNVIFSTNCYTGSVVNSSNRWRSSSSSDGGTSTITPYIGLNSTSYNIGATFYYVGSSSQNISKATFIVARQSTAIGQIRLYDITHGNELGTVTWNSGVVGAPVAIHITSFLNIPLTPAVIEVQVKRMSGSGSLYIYSIIVQ